MFVLLFNIFSLY